MKNVIRIYPELNEVEVVILGDGTAIDSGNSERRFERDLKGHWVQLSKEKVADLKKQPATLSLPQKLIDLAIQRRKEKKPIPLRPFWVNYGLDLTKEPYPELVCERYSKKDGRTYELIPGSEGVLVEVLVQIPITETPLSPAEHSKYNDYRGKRPGRAIRRIK